MADTNRVGLAFVEEATWGTNPATALSDLNFTGESLNFNIDNITSNTIRSDRQVTDLIQTGAQAAGDINFEFQYAAALGTLMQGALWDDEWHGVGSPDQATYTSGLVASNLEFTLVSAANTIALAAGHTTFNPSPGQSFILTGSTSDDGTHTIISVAGATVTVTSITADEVLDESDAATMQMLIQESIVSAAGAGTDDIVSASAGNTLTLGSNIVHDIVVGQWIELTSSTSLADDGYHYVTVVAGNVITVASTGSSPGITLDQTYNAAPTLTIKGARIRNGVTENSYWIERAHADIAEYFSFEGMVINTFNATFSANSIATGSFGMIGKTANLAQATTGTGTNTAAATTSVMNAVANVGNIWIDGTVASNCLVQEISLSLNNNVRGLSSIGTLGFCDIGVGEISVTGNFNLYFLNDTYWDMFKAATSFSLSWKVEDSAGNAYIFFLPEVKFTTDTINVGGKNADVMENTGFQAIMDPTLQFTLQVTRIAA